MSINGVNFIIVHIISQAVLERRNYTVTQKEREPNFKPEYLVTHPELSIGFIPMERSFLCPSIELFWNSLITYAKKNYSFYSLVKMECCWYLKICKIVWFNWNIFAMRQTGQMTILKPCKFVQRNSLVLSYRYKHSISMWLELVTYRKLWESF